MKATPLGSLLAAVTLLFASPVHSAESVVPADRLEISEKTKLIVEPYSPDCRELLLSKPQHRVLADALALHRKQGELPVHQDFAFSSLYKLSIKGTVHTFEIFADEKTVLEILLSTRGPVRNFMVPDAAATVRGLNARALQKLGQEIVVEGPAGFDLNREPSELRFVDPLIALQDLDLTEKQKVFLSALFNSTDELLEYLQMKYVMGWTTGYIIRRATEFANEINRKSLIVRGRPLLETARGLGLRLARRDPKEVPTISQIGNTYAGTISFRGKELMVAQPLGFFAQELEGGFLSVDRKIFEQIGLPKREVIAALEEINREASARFGHPFVRVLNFDLYGLRIQYSFHGDGRFHSRGGWFKPRPRGAKDFVL